VAGLGVSRGVTAALVGLSNGNATPGNVAKAMLRATMFNLRMGSDELDAQGFPRTEIVLSGGLVKTPALGQLLADAFHTPVAIRAAAAKGTAWGAALLADWRHTAVGGSGGSWQEFVEGLARRAAEPVRFTPRPAATAVLDRGYERHRRLVALHAALAAACE
jgi:sugar (pentulose or hexulose) kinase